MPSVRESISIAQVQPGLLYFNPGCAMCVYKPDLSEKILGMLQAALGDVKLHSLCCHHDPQLPEGSVIINNCAGCDRRFRSLYEGVETTSLWEVLDGLDDLKLPDYDGMEVSVHDSCGYRHKPQVHAAIRSLLGKMGCVVFDVEFSGMRSACCGDNLYGHVPNEEVLARMNERAAQFPCEYIVNTCIGCTHAFGYAGKRPLYMPDLICGRITEPFTDSLDEYHNIVSCYTDEH